MDSIYNVKIVILNSVLSSAKFEDKEATYNAIEPVIRKFPDFHPVQEYAPSENAEKL
jgi:hypothetical protein